MRDGGLALRWWRHAALAGLAAGLFSSPSLSAPSGWLPCALASAAGLLALGSRGRLEASGRYTGIGGSVTVAAVAALLGLGLGDARLRAIDGGALRGSTGERVELTGYVVAAPDRSFGEVRIPIDSPAGKVMAVAREPVADVPVGSEIRVEGTLAEPDEFRAAQLARFGAALELRVERMRATGSSRGGPAGLLDGIRGRAEEALGVGVDSEQAALARGFVLGQDERIDPATAESFRRSGTSHLLAVSGQNVMLLAILCSFVLAPTGFGLRSRLAITIAVICVYVPVAGAGPSIQRAGVMGAAAIAATLAGRPADRAYPVLLAAVATLALDPRAVGDVGWQLSFAAVVGIMLWAGSLRDLVRDRMGARIPERIVGPLADGIAVTIAATVATAPLIAAGFERLSLTSLVANVLVLPAVAPVMWLGMAIAMLGQLPAPPPGFLGAVEGVLIDYIVWVATTLGSPAWAQIETPALSARAVAVAYVATSIGLAVGIAALARRRSLRLRPRRRHAAAAALAGAALTLAVGFLAPGQALERPRGTLAVTELDVGQGDATLLEPPHGAPTLIDTGPPGGGIAQHLRERGIERLAALFVTHDELDHAGALDEVLASTRVGTVILGLPSRPIDAAARAAGVRVSAVAEGSAVDLDPLRIDVLWPPRDHIDRPAAEAEANHDSLALVVRFRGWSLLMTGDAEQEATHLEPGPVDILKVAHHGSDDSGLDSLLERSVPRVALIGVGADNGYGHPTDETLSALAEHGVCTLRTDLDGDASVLIGPGGLAVAAEEGVPGATRPACGAGGG